MATFGRFLSLMRNEKFIWLKFTQKLNWPACGFKPVWLSMTGKPRTNSENWKETSFF